jgi:hypothetical protein
MNHTGDHPNDVDRYASQRSTIGPGEAQWESIETERREYRDGLPGSTVDERWG